MTEINHRRGTTRKRYGKLKSYELKWISSSSNKVEVDIYHQGQRCHDFIKPDGRQHQYIDKSMQGWGKSSLFADKRIGASIGNDFNKGHRGMAKSVKGAKKYVRSRFRFHERMALAREVQMQNE